MPGGVCDNRRRVRGRGGPGLTCSLQHLLNGIRPAMSLVAPDVVRPAPFDGATLAGGTLKVRLPAKSVVVLALR